jgi:hypothetical protein
MRSQPVPSATAHLVARRGPPDGPSLEVFEGLAAGGAGLSAFVTARRSDGRALLWQVELWIEQDFQDEQGWATVKGEIDLDDEDGEPWCVLNEQRAVTTAEEAADAIRVLAETVSAYPIPELLANPPPEVGPEY